MLRSALLAGATLAFAAAAPLTAQRPVDCPRHLERTHELIRDWWSFAIFKVGAFDIDASLGELLPEARVATTADDCADVIDRFVAQLRDGHANLVYFPGRTMRSAPEGLTIRRFTDRMLRPGQTRPSQRLHIVEVDPERPELAGIPAGSEILEIEGRPAGEVLDHVEARTSASTTWGLEHWSSNAVLTGPAGTDVRFRIRTPDNEDQEVVLQRPEVSPDERVRRREYEVYADTVAVVEHRLLENNIGYIRLHTFAFQRVVREFDAALQELADTDALIVDLRDNGGGFTDVLAETSGRFFESRRVVVNRIVHRVPGRQTMSSDPQPIIVNRGRRAPLYTKPLVLLVNAGCFSACDMFASVMDEQGRALLIGPTPTGGGTASAAGHRAIPQFDGMIVRASLLVALRQDGSHIEGRGIRPHFIVNSTLQDYINGRDPQLERALRAIAEGDAPAHP